MRLLTGLMGRKSRKDAKADIVAPIAASASRHARDALLLENAMPSQARARSASNTKPVFDAQRPADARLADAQAALKQQSSALGEAPRAAIEPPQAEDSTALQPSPAATSRARRNRTRIIGFEKSSGDIVDLFNEAPATTQKSYVQFPVGWILVVEGPGRGHCFSLFTGMAQIGRGEDQSIQLDFGDTAISRNNHAAVVYDPEEKKFVLGHGGKANIVRLNGKPVVSNVDLSDGDMIKIGETTLQLKALCGPDFEWNTADMPEDDEDDEDVAIA